MATYYVAELHLGLFQNPMNIKPPATSGWRLFSPCTEDNIATCEIFNDLANFSGSARHTLLQFLSFLLEAAKAGRPWKDIFQDGKVFHPVDEVEIERTDPKTNKRTKHFYEVHQFKKKKTSVRILFVYTGERLIALITHAFEKDAKKTPASEKARAENVIKEFFKAVDEKRVELIGDQGGKNATQGIFGN